MHACMHKTHLQRCSFISPLKTALAPNTLAWPAVVLCIYILYTHSKCTCTCVLFLIHSFRFAQLRFWLVNHMLTKAKDARGRGALLTHAIKFLEKLEELNNIASLATVVSALTCDHLKRLKHSWEVRIGPTGVTHTRNADTMIVLFSFFYNSLYFCLVLCNCTNTT